MNLENKEWEYDAVEKSETVKVVKDFKLAKFLPMIE
jgi:hypothetical protein